jgi:hypothetical protein
VFANLSSALNPAVEVSFLTKLSVTTSCQFVFEPATPESFWTLRMLGFWALAIVSYSKTENITFQEMNLVLSPEEGMRRYLLGWFR